MSAESRSLLSDYESGNICDSENICDSWTRSCESTDPLPFNQDAPAGTKESESTSSEMGPEHCRTCYEKIDMHNDTYALLAGCINRHPQQMYHFDCIRPWFAKNKACPVCWRPMRWEDILTNLVNLDENVDSPPDPDLERGGENGNPLPNDLVVNPVDHRMNMKRALIYIITICFILFVALILLAVFT